MCAHRLTRDPLVRRPRGAHVPVVAQHADGRRDVNAPAGVGQRVGGPALARGGVGEAGVEEVRPILHPHALQACGCALDVLEGEPVADRRRVVDPLRRPVPAHRLHDPGLGPIADDVAVVVDELVGVARLPALPVSDQQRGDDVHGLLGGDSPFQGQPQRIHAEQTGPSLALGLGEHRLVADGHAVLVDAHLGAPDPVQLGQQHRMGALHLGDLDVRRPDHVAGVFGRGDEHQLVGLVGLPVAVLGQDHRPVSGGARQADEGVAHRHIVRPPGSLRLGNGDRAVPVSPRTAARSSARSSGSCAPSPSRSR